MDLHLSNEAIGLIVGFGAIAIGIFAGLIVAALVRPN